MQQFVTVFIYVVFNRRRKVVSVAPCADRERAVLACFSKVRADLYNRVYAIIDGVHVCLLFDSSIER